MKEHAAKIAAKVTQAVGAAKTATGKAAASIVGSATFAKAAVVVKSSPALLVLPAALLMACVAWAVSGYTPLVFDESQYDTASAQSLDIDQVDAAALEGEDDGDTSQSSLDGSMDLEDGTWTGYAACGVGNGDGWKPYYVAVTVQIEDGTVTEISDISGSSTGGDGDTALNWDASENQTYLTWAIDGYSGDTGVKDQIESSLSAGNLPSGVDTVSGATYSSSAIYNAFVDALNQAGSSSTASVAATASDSSGSSKKATATSVGMLGDGIWTGYAACGEGNDEDWKPYYVATTVKVKNGKVKKVVSVVGSSTGDSGTKTLNWDSSENQAYLDWAISGRTRGGTFYTGVVTQIKKAISQGKNPTSVDTVSGATYSSEAIFESYYAALKKSAASVGSTVSETGTVTTSTDSSATSSVENEAATTDATLIDGTYSGYAFCQDEDDLSAYSPYYVFVTIEVEDGKVTTISDVWGDAEGLVDSAYIYDVTENGSYLNKAIIGYGLRTKGVKTQIQNKLDAGEDVTSIDTVSGATWSSISIFDAYVEAVNNAVAAAEEAADKDAADE